MGKTSRVLLTVECACLFFLLPPSLVLFRQQLAFKLIPLVLVLALLCILFLTRHHGFHLGQLCSFQGISRHMRGIFATFLPLAALTALFSYLLLPERFLAFPLSKPQWWAAFSLLYPPVAAFPQEVVFRGFFFVRYRALFSTDLSLVLFNGLSFGLAHVIYGNAVAPAVTTLGGMLFAYRYLSTGSLMAVSIEHGLWGNFLFTVGLGWYLYSGSMR